MLKTLDNVHCLSEGGDVSHVANIEEKNKLVNHRERETFSMERRAANGNYIQYACGPLKRPRYINERIE